MQRKRVRKMIIGILIFVAVLLLTTLIFFRRTGVNFHNFMMRMGMYLKTA